MFVGVACSVACGLSQAAFRPLSETASTLRIRRFGLGSLIATSLVLKLCSL
jgi:hypothetical protein